MSESDEPVPPHVDGQPVDFAAPSGATDPADAHYDADHTDHEDDHVGVSHTTFDPEDADDPQRFRELQAAERGLFDGVKNRRSQQREGHRKRDVSHFCDIIGVTDGEKQRVYEIVDAINLDELHDTADSDAVILAAITIACNEHDRDPRPESHFADETLTETYAELRTVTDTDTSTVRRIRKKWSDNTIGE